MSLLLATTANQGSHCPGVRGGREQLARGPGSRLSEPVWGLSAVEPCPSPGRECLSREFSDGAVGSGSGGAFGGLPIKCRFGGCDPCPGPCFQQLPTPEPGGNRNGEPS